MAETRGPQSGGTRKRFVVSEQSQPSGWEPISHVIVESIKLPGTIEEGNVGLY